MRASFEFDDEEKLGFGSFPIYLSWNTLNMTNCEDWCKTKKYINDMLGNWWRFASVYIYVWRNHMLQDCWWSCDWDPKVKNLHRCIMAKQGCLPNWNCNIFFLHRVLSITAQLNQYLSLTIFSTWMVQSIKILRYYLANQLGSLTNLWDRIEF